MCRGVTYSRFLLFVLNITIGMLKYSHPDLIIISGSNTLNNFDLSRFVPLGIPGIAI